MLLRFPIELVQAKKQVIIKTGYLLNEICEILYSLYQAKEITIKLYKIMMNSIRL